MKDTDTSTSDLETLLTMPLSELIGGYTMTFRKLAPPVAEPIVIHDPVAQEMGDYYELARKAGFDGVSTIIGRYAHSTRVAEFRRILAANGICIYPFPAVARYLWKNRPFRHLPVWLPMSEAAKKYYVMYDGHGKMNDYRMGTNRDLLYAKPIPPQVLLTKIKLDAAFQAERFDAHEFYVSDYKYEDDVNPKYYDPFLAIMFNEMYVIERWDEPSFRMS